MNPRIIFLSLIPVALLAACGKEEPAEPVTAVVSETATEAVAPVPEVVSIPRYSAEAFFETTSYRLAGSSGFAFSPDGSKLLIRAIEDGMYVRQVVQVTELI